MKTTQELTARLAEVEKAIEEKQEEKGLRGHLSAMYALIEERKELKYQIRTAEMGNSPA